MDEPRDHTDYPVLTVRHLLLKPSIFKKSPVPPAFNVVIAYVPTEDVYSLTATVYYCIAERVPPHPLDRLIGEGLISPRNLRAFTAQQELALLHSLQVAPHPQIPFNTGVPRSPV